MKCPFRKTVIHQPDRTEGYTRHFAQDIETYPDCYENQCPFYFSGQCMRAEAEIERGERE